MTKKKRTETNSPGAGHPSSCDIFTGDPTEYDINELLVKMTERLTKARGENTPRKKMSYSISPLSQVLIKNISEETGITQGNIVESAPLLFGKIISDSLERRSNALDTLRTLHKQIKSSLSSFAAMAPHLKPFTDHVKTVMDDIVDMEGEAVKEKNYQGVTPSAYPSLNKLDTSGEVPPYYKEMEEFLEDNAFLSAIFKNYSR